MRWFEIVRACFAIANIQCSNLGSRQESLEFPKANPECTECKLHFGDCPLKGIIVYAPRSLRCGGERLADCRRPLGALFLARCSGKGRFCGGASQCNVVCQKHKMICNTARQACPRSAGRPPPQPRQREWATPCILLLLKRRSSGKRSGQTHIMTLPAPGNSFTVASSPCKFCISATAPTKF